MQRQIGIRRHGRAARGSLAVLGLALTMGTAACDTEEAKVEGDATTFRAGSTPNFALRVGDMARAADAAYYDGDADHQELAIRGPGGSTMVHRHRWDLSAKKIQVYEYVSDDGKNYSLIVSFRGTRPTSWDDIRADLTGLVSKAVNPANPWRPGTTIQGEVGKGFNRRVVEYMEGVNASASEGRVLHTTDHLEYPGCTGVSGGEALRCYVEHVMNLDGTKIDVHVVGHSLGGIASQLFSIYLGRFMRAQAYDASRYRVFNFAFNSPKGGDCVFVNEFATNVNDGVFVPFNFTMEHDPVSTWNLTVKWLGLIDQPNDTEPFMRGHPVGYCPHAQLPPVVPQDSIQNHALDDQIIGSWETLLGTNSVPLLHDVATCMKAAYEPLTLEIGG